jgi:hypothetical protein
MAGADFELRIEGEEERRGEKRTKEEKKKRGWVGGEETEAAEMSKLAINRECRN